ncbi:50S ribosomal protein L25 [Lutibacter sp. B2]|nr:50S ribosomal protein L25 [Lutibacter sp. B2]
MQIPLLKAEQREKTRKTQLKTLRKEGFVPAILYSYNKKTRHISLQRKELDRILNEYGVGSSVQVEINDEKSAAIIKEIQRHITKDYVLHIDLQELDENKKIKVKIPLRAINKAAVESSISFIQQQKVEVEIQTYPKYLPQLIQVDVSEMKFGEPILIKDLDIYNDENIEVLENGGEIVALLATNLKVESTEKELTTEEKLRKW